MGKYGEPWRLWLPPMFTFRRVTSAKILRHKKGAFGIEDKKRAIACVNALSGMDAEAVAELVAAAEYVARDESWNSDPVAHGQRIYRLRAALAKLRRT
jgi:hypothetical protein